MNIADLWERQQVLEEFDRDDITPVMGSGHLNPPPVDLGPVSRICQAPKVSPCYICMKLTDTMFFDKTQMCMGCATMLGKGMY